MKSILVAAVAAGLATFALAVPSFAWEVVGITEATRQPDDDRVRVDSDERFQSIMLCAYQAPVVISSFDVTFKNGRGRSSDEDIRLDSGECTNAIGLGGRGRRLDVIELSLRVDSNSRGHRDRFGWGRWRFGNDDARDHRRDRDRPGRATVVMLAD